MRQKTDHKSVFYKQLTVSCVVIDGFQLLCLRQMDSCFKTGLTWLVKNEWIHQSSPMNEWMNRIKQEAKLKGGKSNPDSWSFIPQSLFRKWILLTKELSVSVTKIQNHSDYCNYFQSMTRLAFLSYSAFVLLISLQISQSAEVSHFISSYQDLRHSLKIYVLFSLYILYSPFFQTSTMFSCGWY